MPLVDSIRPVGMGNSAGMLNEDSIPGEPHIAYVAPERLVLFVNRAGVLNEPGPPVEELKAIVALVRESVIFRDTPDIVESVLICSSPMYSWQMKYNGEDE